MDVYREDLIYLGTLTLPHLLEAAVRAGELNAAAAGLDRLAARALAASTLWARGLLARSSALLVDDAQAEACYQEASRLLRQCRMAPDLARAQLRYGEWLRRQRRRLDARTQLRYACDAFDSMGARLRGTSYARQANMPATGEPRPASGSPRRSRRSLRRRPRGARIWRLRRSCSSARAQSTTTYARYSANLAWGRVPSLLAPWLNSRKTRLLPVSGDTTRREPRLCKYWICEAGISLTSTPRS
jgi:hypothetical protein